MANSKLIEVLRTLSLERETISAHIDKLQRELDVVEEAVQSIRKIADENRASVSDVRKTNIQMVEDILRNSVEPLHILEIVAKMAEIRGVDLSRANIETAISRYLNTPEIDYQIERLGDGMYRHRSIRPVRRVVRSSEGRSRII